MNQELLKIRASAQSMLAKREHSKHELLRKLTQKGFETVLTEQVVQELQQENLQSDARFCEMLIRSRVNKGYGRKKITMEFSEHQIASELVQKALAESDIDWFSLCQQVFERKFKGGLGRDWKARQKQMRYLMNRGFSHEEIREAIGE